MGIEHEKGRENSCFPIEENTKNRGFLENEVSEIPLQAAKTKVGHNKWSIFVY